MDPPQYSSAIEPSSSTSTVLSSPTLPPEPAPVVLSYTPPIPTENPPEYIAARRPTKPIIYSFSPLSFNSMILVPPADAPDSRPPYHISISMNCFIPSLYITTIRRGGTEYGECVGDFQMGIASKNPGTVFIDGEEKLISAMLIKNGSRTSPTASWTWKTKYPRRILQWDNGTNPSMCRLSIIGTYDSKILAKFYRVTGFRGQNNSSRSLPELQVLPEGQEYFDDVLMSLLIIERYRLSP